MVAWSVRGDISNAMRNAPLVVTALLVRGVVHFLLPRRGLPQLHYQLSLNHLPLPLSMSL